MRTVLVDHIGLQKRLPLVTYNNEPVRVENLAGTGIYLLHYNKYTNQVFLVSGGYKATATPSA